MRTLMTAHIALYVLLAASQLFASEDIYQDVLRSSAFVVAGSSQGSGALVDADKRIVFTNYHVVGETKDVRVMFPQFADGELVTSRQAMLDRNQEDGIPGKVIETDPRRDLALIQLESVPADVEPIKLASRSAGPGQTVHSIGNPATSMAMWLYTSGTVRQLYRREFTLENQQEVNAHIIETDQPINKGDSGGPVVNSKGELVAVVSAFSKTGNLVSLAIDIRELKALLNGDNSTSDRRIKELAIQENWSYKARPDGAFLLQIPTDNGISQVRVESKTSEYLQVAFRSVISLGKTFEGELESGLAEKLMVDSMLKKFGAWQIERGEKTNFLLYKVDVPEDTSDTVLRASILLAANVTADFRKNLEKPTGSNATTAKDWTSPTTTPQATITASDLTGTWTSRVEKGQQTINFQVTFGADGSIAWSGMNDREQILKLRGTFKIQDNDLHYVCDETLYQAKIRLLDSNRLAYDDGSIKLTLLRNDAASTPPSTASQPTLSGRWISTEKTAAGISTTNIMTFKDNQFTWTSRVGKIELTNLSGDYTLTGNELKLKATAGLNLKATIKLLDNQRMSFKDNTNDLEFTRE